MKIQHLLQSTLLAIVLPGIALAPLRSEAATAALYTFPTSGGTTLPSASSDSDPGSTASSLSLGAGFTSAGISISAGDPVNSLFIRPADNSTEANAFAGNRYFTFTITPSEGSLSYLSLSFDYMRDTSDSAGNLALYVSSTGSFTSGANVLADSMPVATVFTNRSFDLSSIAALQNVSDPVTFRLYIWGASNQTTVTRFDNITLTANPVPEPGTWISFCVGLGLLLCLRRPSRPNSKLSQTAL